jgi:hypothetical protein
MIGDVDEILGYQLNDHKNRLPTHNNGKRIFTAIKGNPKC